MEPEVRGPCDHPQLLEAALPTWRCDTRFLGRLFSLDDTRIVPLKVTSTEGVVRLCVWNCIPGSQSQRITSADLHAGRRGDGRSKIDGSAGVGLAQRPSPRHPRHCAQFEPVCERSNTTILAQLAGNPRPIPAAMGHQRAQATMKGMLSSRRSSNRKAPLTSLTFRSLGARNLSGLDGGCNCLSGPLDGGL